MLYFSVLSNVNSIQVSCTFIWSSLQESQINSYEKPVAKERRRNEGIVCQLKVLVNNTPDSENRYQRALLVTQKVFFCVSDIKNKALFKFI